LTFFATPVYAAFNLTWNTPSSSIDMPPPLGDSDLNITVESLPNGSAVAAWSRTVDNGNGEDVWAATYDHKTRSWSSPVKISGGGVSLSPAIALDTVGNAIFMWEEGFQSQIMCRVLSAKGNWTPSLKNAPDFVSPSKNAQIFPLAIHNHCTYVAIAPSNDWKHMDAMGSASCHGTCWNPRTNQ